MNIILIRFGTINYKYKYSETNIFVMINNLLLGNDLLLICLLKVVTRNGQKLMIKIINP